MFLLATVQAFSFRVDRDLEVGCWVTWLIKDHRVLDILRNTIFHSSHLCGCEGLWVGCENMSLTLEQYVLNGLSITSPLLGTCIGPQTGPGSLGRGLYILGRKGRDGGIKVCLLKLTLSFHKAFQPVNGFQAHAIPP